MVREERENNRNPGDWSEFLPWTQVQNTQNTLISPVSMNLLI